MHKAEYMVPMLKAFVKLHPISDSDIAKAIEKMEYGKARDPENNNPKAVKCSKNVKNGKVVQTNYAINVAYTVMETPPLGSPEEEIEWIEQALTKLTDRMKEIQTHDEYRHLYPSMCSERMFAAINAQSENKINLWKFVKTATPIFKQTDSYNKHLVLEHANAIQTEILDAIIANKYNENGDDEEEEDNENEDEESENEKD